MALLLPEWWIFFFIYFFFYVSWQFWFPRPHLPGTSDRGAQRERHYSGLTTVKWQTLPGLCKTFPSVLVLVLDITRLQVVLWDCWLKTRSSADERLMLQQSPHHFTSCSSVVHFPPELSLTQCYMWKKILSSAVHSCMTNYSTCHIWQ